MKKVTKKQLAVLNKKAVKKEVVKLEKARKPLSGKVNIHTYANDKVTADKFFKKHI